MKRIIAGKKYDTETAKKLHEISGDGEFGAFVERLYIKKTGEYFLSCIGAKYQITEEYDYTDIPAIYPLSEEQAKYWGEKWMDADKYEEIFGEVEEQAIL